MSLIETARRVRDSSRTTLQRQLLRRGMAALDRALSSADNSALSPRTLDKLVRGWGNEAWSVDVPLLLGILEWLPKSTGSIVECGSGLSTLVMATAARHSKRKVFSFENNQKWAAQVQKHLPDDLRAHVEISVSPIKSYGEFDWYSVDQQTVPKSIGFVLCDGPPGTTCGGRYGLGPILRPLLSDGCIIILDDTQRHDEQLILQRWCSELPASVVHEAETYMVLCVGKAPVAATTSPIPL